LLPPPFPTPTPGARHPSTSSKIFLVLFLLLSLTSLSILDTLSSPQHACASLARAPAHPPTPFSAFLAPACCRVLSLSSSFKDNFSPFKPSCSVPERASPFIRPVPQCRIIISPFPFRRAFAFASDIGIDKGSKVWLVFATDLYTFFRNPLHANPLSHNARSEGSLYFSPFRLLCPSRSSPCSSLASIVPGSLSGVCCSSGVIFFFPYACPSC